MNLRTKLEAMLWDIPVSQRSDLVSHILANPYEAFQNNEKVFVKALNTLKWYDLIKLLGRRNLLALLSDSTIQKLFPAQRRMYYANAKRLLSKYSVPSSR